MSHIDENYLIKIYLFRKVYALNEEHHHFKNLVVCHACIEDSVWFSRECYVRQIVHSFFYGITRHQKKVSPNLSLFFELPKLFFTNQSIYQITSTT